MKQSHTEAQHSGWTAIQSCWKKTWERGAKKEADRKQIGGPHLVCLTELTGTQTPGERWTYGGVRAPGQELVGVKRRLGERSQSACRQQTRESSSRSASSSRVTTAPSIRCYYSRPWIFLSYYHVLWFIARLCTRRHACGANVWRQRAAFGS